MSTEKSAEVAVVDADDLGVDAPARARARSSSWTSTSTSRSSAARLAVQRAEVACVERGDDQQHRVGAGRRRLVHLVGVDDEVLAQDRQRAGRARLAQVVERAAEVRALGEDRQRRRAAALVGLDDLGHRRAARGSRPRCGERRLCSAITRDARAAPAPRRTGGPRGARRARARARPAAPRCAPALDVAARVDSTMRSRTLIAGRQLAGQRDEARRARARAAPESIAPRGGVDALARACRRGRARRSRRRR